jgi:hypothetical protein
MKNQYMDNWVKKRRACSGFKAENQEIEAPLYVPSEGTCERFNHLTSSLKPKVKGYVVLGEARHRHKEKQQSTSSN